MRLTDGPRKAIHGPRTVHARVAQRAREDAAGRGQKTFEMNELAECSNAGSGTLQHNTRVELLPPLERCGGLASIRVELTTPITPSPRQPTGEHLRRMRAVRGAGQTPPTGPGCSGRSPRGEHVVDPLVECLLIGDVHIDVVLAGRVVFLPGQAAL